MAYSETKGKIVDVNDEFNLDEIFCCPDLNCPAKLKIRSPFGKTAKHFAQLKSKPHSKECIYASGNQRYLATKSQIRFSIEDIYSDMPVQKPVTSVQANGSHSKELPPTKAKRIRTPRDLYEFCIVNRLSTEYQNGKTVGDIVLDDRNLAQSKCLEGFDGLRLVIGKTVKYNANELIVSVESRGKKDQRIWLTAHVVMPPPIIQELRKYLFDTHGNFKGHKIGIFEVWKKEAPYHVSCTVRARQHLIYKRTE